MLIKRFLNILIVFLFLFNFSLPLAEADVWEAPPASPPNGNRSRPIDISSDPQIKTGSLSVQGGLNAGSTNQLQVDYSGNLTIPGLTISGSPSMSFGNSLIYFNANSQSSLSINSNISQGQGLLSAVASIANGNNQDAAYSLRLMNAGNNTSAALYSSNSGAGWAGYFQGPLGGSSYIVVGGAVQGGYSGAGDAYFYDDVGTVGDVTVGGGLSTYDATVADNTVETSQLCLGNGANCITAWNQAGSSLWTDGGNNIYASNVTSPSEFRVYDAAYGGVKIRNNNLQLDNNSLIYQTTDSGSSPVLINDQLMIGRRYDTGCGHYCGSGADPGVDLANNENLIFGRVRNNPTGNTNQNLLRLQQGNGTDAQIDKFVIDLSGNVTSAGGTINGYGNASLVYNSSGSYAPDAVSLQIKDYTTTLLTVKDSGVGIGTIDPGAKLEVAGQVKITGGSPGAGKVLTSDADGLATWQPAVNGADNLGNHIATQQIQVTGGVSGAAPTPQISFSNYYDNANNPSIDHINLYNSQYGFGISSGDLDIFSSRYIKFHSSGNSNYDAVIIDGYTGDLTTEGYISVGGGYGSTGATIYNLGNISTKGNLTTDGSISVGGGYGSSGVTISSAGNISADGEIVFGSATKSIGAGHNLIYGNIDTASVGNLLLLQKENGGGQMEDKFKVDKNGNTVIGGDATTTGDIIVGGNDIKNSNGHSTIQFSNGNVIIRLGQ